MHLNTCKRKCFDHSYMYAPITIKDPCAHWATRVRGQPSLFWPLPSHFLPQTLDSTLRAKWRVTQSVFVGKSDNIHPSLAVTRKQRGTVTTTMTHHTMKVAASRRQNLANGHESSRCSNVLPRSEWTMLEKVKQVESRHKMSTKRKQNTWNNNFPRQTLQSKADRILGGGHGGYNCMTSQTAATLGPPPTVLVSCTLYPVP